jgi:ABC-type sugar transport system permease subunit
MEKDEGNMEKSISIFLLLPFIFLSIFLLIPIGFTVVLSFCSWWGYGPITFVGLDNFIKIFTIERFQRALINNLLWIIGVIFVPMFFGLILAYILLDVKGKRIFTAALWIPYAISPVALGYIFYFVFDPKIGLINSTLEILGLGFLKRAWLSSWPLNTFSLIIGSWWNRFAFSTIVYLAGMTTISRDIIDAAKTDGCVGFHQLRKIIFPLLRPFTAIILAWSVLYSFQDNFGFIYVTTEGGPFRSSEVIGISMYLEGFMSSNMGIASALAFLSTIITLTAAIIILSRSKGG